MDAKVEFELWFLAAQQQWHKAGFVEGSLDEDVARDAYNEGQSVEVFIEEMVDRHGDD